MSDDLVSRLRQDAEMLQDGPQSNLTKLWHSEVVKDAAKDCQEAATALTEARAEIERLRNVACDCASAIGNGAALSPESSLDFIELLPGEIAKHTDKLRRFLKCARDEGTEALDRADAAESELSTLRAELDASNANHRQMATTMADLAREHDTLRARVREVVGPFASTDLLECKDCVDNDGKHYQSQWLADALRAARQLNEDLK